MSASKPGELAEELESERNDSRGAARRQKQLLTAAQLKQSRHRSPAGLFVKLQ